MAGLLGTCFARVCLLACQRAEQETQEVEVFLQTDGLELGCCSWLGHIGGSSIILILVD
jgi:hypothetical protein